MWRDAITAAHRLTLSVWDEVDAAAVMKKHRTHLIVPQLLHSSWFDTNRGESPTKPSCLSSGFHSSRLSMQQTGGDKYFDRPRDLRVFQVKHLITSFFQCDNVNRQLHVCRPVCKSLSLVQTLEFIMKDMSPPLGVLCDVIGSVHHKAHELLHLKGVVGKLGMVPESGMMTLWNC